ncbi:MAG TPA: c-type cytochrome biogenesis protein CcsB [Streptosporangiaceae bacterium]|nr:c-type cytochrome biogenesis protein CcsB [Streptosporangiaceae bacterium]
MAINQGLSHLSDHFLMVTLVFYFLAVLAFAADFAFGRRSPAAEPARADVPELVTAGAAGGTPVAGGSAAGGGTAGTVGAATGPARPGLRDASRWVQAGLTLTVLGVLAHIAGVVTRGLAVHRVPWGDMYEFIIAVTCVAVLFFLGLMIRYRPYRLGLFFMAPIVIIIGLAQTVIYTPAGPLVPALNSYWLAIHVTAITLATGTYVVAAVLAVVYLVADRHSRRVAAGLPVRNGEAFRLLPSPERLDQFAYRTVVFAFPLWTFGIMAGAIWADEAWGRYWGWDPTETWAFITWVVYACFLHARVTAGWRGRRAAYIQLAGFGCLLFNLLGVSLFITGLHSYAGLS